MKVASPFQELPSSYPSHNLTLSLYLDESLFTKVVHSTKLYSHMSQDAIHRSEMGMKKGKAGQIRTAAQYAIIKYCPLAIVEDVELSVNPSLSAFRICYKVILVAYAEGFRSHTGSV